MRPTPPRLALVDPVRIALAQITTRCPGRTRSTSDGRTAVPDRGCRTARSAVRSRAARPRLRGAPGVRLAITTDALRRTRRDNLDLGIVFGRCQRDARTTSSACSAPTPFYACSTPTGRCLAADLTRRTTVRLPHVLTSQRKGEQGVVDEASRCSGSGARSCSQRALRGGTISRAGAAVVTTMHAKLARFFTERSGSASARCRLSCGSSHHAGLARLLRS